jgi:hypothetical protein
MKHCKVRPVFEPYETGYVVGLGGTCPPRDAHQRPPQAREMASSLAWAVALSGWRPGRGPGPIGNLAILAMLTSPGAMSAPVLPAQLIRIRKRFFLVNLTTYRSTYDLPTN